MALNNFNDKPVENNLDLRCSLCPEPWSVRMDGHKPMCSKHAWEKKDAPQTTQFYRHFPERKHKTVAQIFENDGEIF